MDFMLRAKDTGQVNISRILARGFVLLGGAFWTIAFFAANTTSGYSSFVYTIPELKKATLIALMPLALTIAVFVLGFFFERITGALLVAIALAMLLWGFVGHLDAGTGVWITAVSVLVLPTAVSGVLYLLAAGAQEAQGSLSTAT